MLLGTNGRVGVMTATKVEEGKCRGGGKMCLLGYRVLWHDFSLSLGTVRQLVETQGKEILSAFRAVFLIDNRELKQTDAAAANLQISTQKDSRPSEFSRPLTSITLNLNGLPVDRHHICLRKLPNE